MLAFDTDLAPAVGQQVTLAGGAAADARPRIDLLRARAAAGYCDLVVKGILDGEQQRGAASASRAKESRRGWLQVSGGVYVGDRAADAPVGDATLRAGAARPGQALTYTCVPPGSGARAGIDRDEDGFLDRDEVDGGADPADGSSRPAGEPLPLARVLVGTSALELVAARAPAPHTRLAFVSRTGKNGGAARIAPPGRGTAFDPTLHGVELRVYNARFTADAVAVPLPARGWRHLGSARRPKGYRFRARDAGGGSIRSAVLAPDAIRVRGRVAYTLDEPAQGRVAVALVPGLFAAGGWCAAAPRAPSGASARPRATTARDASSPPGSRRHRTPALPLREASAPPPASRRRARPPRRRRDRPTPAA